MNLFARAVAVATTLGLVIACGHSTPHSREQAPPVPPGAPSETLPSTSADASANDAPAADSCRHGRRRDDGSCGPPDGMPCWPDCNDTDRKDELDERELQTALRPIVSSCRSGNMVHGVVTITVLPTGRIEQIALTELDPPRDDVRECVREKTTSLRVRPFQGWKVTTRFRF
jgi:hypothetical protein